MLLFENKNRGEAYNTCSSENIKLTQSQIRFRLTNA